MAIHSISKVVLRNLFRIDLYSICLLLFISVPPRLFFVCCIVKHTFFFFNCAGMNSRCGGTNNIDEKSCCIIATALSICVIQFSVYIEGDIICSSGTQLLRRKDNINFPLSWLTFMCPLCFSTHRFTFFKP